MHDPIIPAPVTLPMALEDVAARARAFHVSADAENTRRAYVADLAHFVEWCRSVGRNPLPADAETVALYLTAHADTLKPSTLARRMSAISRAHQDAKHETPTVDPGVRRVMRGIRREKTSARTQKLPIAFDELRAILAALGTGPIGARDRALFLVGFHGGFRRSELVALDFADIVFQREGVKITVRRSKTDQEGAGMVKGLVPQSDVNLCPVRALREWLDLAAISDGPIFRSVNRHGHISADRLSERSVALIVKRASDAAGLDADKFSGHSLRAGLVTQAARDGAPEHVIASMTGHKSVAVLRSYVRNANVFTQNVGCYIRASR